MAEPKKGDSKTGPLDKRTYVSQSDIPSVPLDQALRVARALADHYAYKPTPPLRVASAMNMQPDSGPFRALCGAAIAYGLTKGGYNAAEISLEPLGLKVVRPLAEGDDAAAKREALLRPRLVGEFLRRYDGAKLPRADIARNVLSDLGVPIERAEKALDLIIEGARSVGLLREIKGTTYVDLSGTNAPAAAGNEGGDDPAGEDGDDAAEEGGSVGSAPASVPNGPVATPPSTTRPPARVGDGSRRVFISHGKKRDLIEQIKEIVSFGKLDPVVSVEKESPSIPVPEKVMDDMRSCFAGIIHVASDEKIVGENGKPRHKINDNVLIEIGAAMALYGRNFILLVEDGLDLPSNLQGLYQCRYTGDALDGAATMKLLKAFNEFDSVPKG